MLKLTSQYGIFLVNFYWKCLYVSKHTRVKWTTVPCFCFQYYILSTGEWFTKSYSARDPSILNPNTGHLLIRLLCVYCGPKIWALIRIQLIMLTRATLHTRFAYYYRPIQLHWWGFGGVSDSWWPCCGAGLVACPGEGVWVQTCTAWGLHQEGLLQRQARPHWGGRTGGLDSRGDWGSEEAGTQTDGGT